MQLIFMLIGWDLLFTALTAVSFVSASPRWQRKICGAGLVMNGSTIATTGSSPGQTCVVGSRTEITANQRSDKRLTGPMRGQKLADAACELPPYVEMTWDEVRRLMI